MMASYVPIYWLGKNVNTFYVSVPCLTSPEEYPAEEDPLIRNSGREPQNKLRLSHVKLDFFWGIRVIT